MESHNLLQDLLILFGLATAVAVLLYRVRQSTIVAYLLTGIVVGPYGLGLISNREAIELMAEVGVVLLLFTIGLEFSLKRFLRMRQVVLGAGTRQIVLTAAVVFSLGLVLGFPWRQSLVGGLLIAASSTAIVLKLLFDRQELESPHGRVILGVLLFQDLCVVPMMAVLPALTVPSAIFQAVLKALVEALAVLAVVLLVARYVFPRVWRPIVFLRNKEIFLLATIFFSLGTAWGAAALGLSLALGAFLAGLALSESEYAHQILSEILPFRDAFNSLFFISIGMLLNLQFVRTHWMPVALFAAGIFLIKLITGTGAVVTMGFPVRTSILVGLGLAQMGEFSFILLRQASELALIGTDDFQTLLAAAVITMMLTPLVIQTSPALAARLPEMRRLRRFFPEPGEAELIQEARPLHDHVIVCGYGLNGQLTAEVLRRARVPYLILELNPENVRRAAARGEPIFFGDASNTQILTEAGIRQARVIVYAISDPFVMERAVAAARNLNPLVAIIARTKRLEEEDALKRAGANTVVAEELRAAEEIIICLLGLYGIQRADAFDQIQSARTHEPPPRVE